MRFSDLQYTLTGADGRFRLEGAPGGLHRLVARAPGFVPRWIWTDVAHGDDPFVRFTLAAGAVIEGTVFGPDGEPVEGAAVEGGGSDAVSDAAGRYRLEGVPLDGASRRVRASLGRSFVGEAPFPGFEPGETRAALDLHLEKGYVLRGRDRRPSRAERRARSRELDDRRSRRSAWRRGRARDSGARDPGRRSGLAAPVPHGRPADRGRPVLGKPVRIKILPGAYRVRFEVKESYATSRDLAVRELDIVVPTGGEVEVTVSIER